MTSNFKRNYTIRGTNRDTNIPHAACPQCHTDCVSHDPGQLIEYRCQRGHAFTGYRSDGLNHARFLTTYRTGTEANR